MLRHKSKMSAPMMGKTLNFNVGVLGHVDSGKTSLVKALSTTASTASFDKNPQSRERGITLDLGFSCFAIDLPSHLGKAVGVGDGEKLQYTLVDCPGHASLIRTIIGGAQIIDLMLLVIDVTKGIQTQTAECLVIGQIACERMIVVINKVDLIPESKRQATVEKMSKRVLKTLESTRFAQSPVVCVSAKPGGPESSEAPDTGSINALIKTLQDNTYRPTRSPSGPFIFSVDHCFSIRGQGTVITGTVLSGSVRVNDTVEIPSLKVTKKVKSMQMFRQPVDMAMQGDRVGVCVTQFDPKLLERGLVCTPSALPTICAAIVSVKKIPYYKSAITSKAKFHITMGHETVMGRVLFFGLSSSSDGLSGDAPSGESSSSGAPPDEFNLNEEYNYMEELFDDDMSETTESMKRVYALLEFEKCVTCSPQCLVIGSRLDTDIHTNTCRLAFHGQLLLPISDPKYTQTVLPSVRVYKTKRREGLVERVMDPCTIVGRSLFKKESNLMLFVGLKVSLSTGEEGVIEGGFGQSGKYKVRIPGGLQQSTVDRYSGRKKGKDKAEAPTGSDAEPVKVLLNFKRFLFDPKKQMIQT